MRLYDEKDVSALLRRAAELQARQEGGQASGLTLEELQGIAREVGIDPRYVEQAARQSAQVPVKDDTTYFWGAPGRASAERVLPGEMTDELWETIVMEARRVFGQTGKTDEVGRTREWRWDYYGSYTMAFLSAAPRKGQTALHVERRMDNEAVVSYMPLLMLSVLAGVLLPLKFGLLGLGVGLTLIALSFFAGRAIYASMSRKARRKLDDLLDRIELAATDLMPASVAAGPVAAPPVAAPPVAPRLSLPEDPAPGTDVAEGDRTRTT